MEADGIHPFALDLVTDDAIAAACQAEYELNNSDDRERMRRYPRWSAAYSPSMIRRYKQDMRTILLAAAPHVAAQALKMGADGMISPNDFDPDEVAPPPEPKPRWEHHDPFDL